MSFLTKHYVEVRCDLALDQHNCRVSYAGETEEIAERGALGAFWVKRGWKHYCPECVRRQAIEKQNAKLRGET
jgi:hypothetical protein